MFCRPLKSLTEILSTPTDFFVLNLLIILSTDELSTCWKLKGLSNSWFSLIFKILGWESGSKTKSLPMLSATWVKKLLKISVTLGVSVTKSPSSCKTILHLSLIAFFEKYGLIVDQKSVDLDCLKLCVIYVMLFSIRPEKRGKSVFVFSNFVQNSENIHRIGWKI